METSAVAPTTDEDEIAHKAFRKLHPGLAAEYLDEFNCNDMFQKNLTKGPDPLSSNIINSPRKSDSQKSKESQAASNISDREIFPESNNESQQDIFEQNGVEEYLDSENDSLKSATSIDVFPSPISDHTKNEEYHEISENDTDTEIKKALKSPSKDVYTESEKRNYSTDSSIYSNRGKTYIHIITQI